MRHVHFGQLAWGVHRAKGVAFFAQQVALGFAFAGVAFGLRHRRVVLSLGCITVKLLKKCSLEARVVDRQPAPVCQLSDAVSRPVPRFMVGHRQSQSSTSVAVAAAAAAVDPMKPAGGNQEPFPG